MRTVNVRFTVILAIVVLGLGIGTYVLHGYQVRRNAYIFKEAANRSRKQAEAALQQRNANAANKAYIDSFRNMSWYVRFVPTDTAAVEEFGLMMADYADLTQDVQAFGRAYSILERAVRQDPERKTARRRLIDMAIMARRFQDAKEHLKALLDQSPNDAQLWLLRGQCCEHTGDHDLAVDYFRKALSLDPSLVQAYWQLAMVLQGPLSQPKAADQCIEQMVKANPKSSQAHYWRGLYLLQKSSDNESAVNANDNDTKSADPALTEAVQAMNLAGDNRTALQNALILTAQCYLAKGDFKKAKEYAARGIKLYPNAINMYTIMAGIELRNKNRQAAIDALNAGLNATERNPQLLWALANLLIDINQLKDANQVIDELQSRDYSKPLIDYLKARIEYAQGHWLTARVGFQNVRPTLTMLSRGRDLLKQVDVWIGNCFGHTGNRDRQLQAYRRALNIDPFYGPARLGITDVLMATGNVDDAIREYNQIAKSGKLTASALIPMARMMILQNLRKPAAQRDWRHIESLLDRADKLLPTSQAAQIAVMRADVLIAQNHVAEAESLLNEAKAKYPDQVELWTALATLAERQEDWKKTDAILAMAEKTFGDTVALRLAKAHYIVRRYGKKGGERLSQLDKNTSHFTTDQRTQIRNGLITAAVQIDDPKLAMELCRLIAKDEPFNVQIRYVLFEQYMRMGDQKGMEQALNEIEKVAGRGDYWNYGQAVRLSMAADRKKENPPSPQTMEMLDQAVKYLSAAKELRPNWSRIPLLMGGIYDQQGQFDLALKEYMEAIEMGEHNPNAIRRAVQILFRKQRYSEASELLHELESQQIAFSSDLSRVSAEIALQQGEFDRALEMAEKSAVSQSKNPHEQLWLGQVLAIVGRRAKAEQKTEKAEQLLTEAEHAIRRAVELEPEEAANWVALVQFYSANNDNRRAEQTIEEAQKKISPKQAALALAQCYEAVKKMNLAQKQYETALEAAPHDPFTVRSAADFYYRIDKLTKAETLLQQLIEGKIPASKSDVAWARRQEALVLADRGGFQNLEKARALIAENLAGTNVSTADYRAKATLDAADPRRSRREEAIETWESMLKDQSASPEDRLKLVRMYLRSNDWYKANTQLRNLVAQYPNDARYLSTYISALLAHGETSSAKIYLEQLERLHPNHIITVGLRAETLVADGQPEQALKLLNEFIGRPDAQPSEKATRQLMICEKLEQLAAQMKTPADKAMRERFLQRSEMLLRVYVTEHPNHEWLLAAFLARQHRFDDSLNVLNRIWQSMALDGIGRICSVLIEQPMNNEQMNRLNRLLDAVLDKFDRPAALLMVQADLFTHQTRYADAEKNYREVLKKNGTNAYALNNLAVLLALQGVHLEDSLQYVNQAIQIAGPLPAMLDSRTSIYTAMGKTEKALADIAQALADAETPVRLFHQAVAYDRAGQSNAAALSMTKALDKGLAKNMLQPLEYPTFDKLKKLSR